MGRNIAKRFVEGFVDTVGLVLDMVFVAIALAVLFSPEIARAISNDSNGLDRRFAAFPLLVLLLVMLFKAVWDEAAEGHRELAKIRSRLPLTVSAHPYNNFRCIALRNPNSFDVADCFVEVAEPEMALPPIPPKYEHAPVGFRFAWSTLQGADGRISAGESIITDIVVFQDIAESVIDHLAPGPTVAQNIRRYPLPFGEYWIPIKFGSRSSGIPTAEAILHIVFEEGDEPGTVQTFDLEVQAVNS